MNEEAAAQDYLVDYLEADATLSGMLEGGVWTMLHPQTVRTPVVKVERLDAEDLYVIGLHRVWDDLTYLIRGIVRQEQSGQADFTVARQIGDRIDALLHDHEEQTAELEVHSFREESYVQETLEENARYLHVGGIYRVRARAV